MLTESAALRPFYVVAGRTQVDGWVFGQWSFTHAVCCWCRWMMSEYCIAPSLHRQIQTSIP